MDQSKKKFLKNMVGFSMMTWISFLLGFLSSPIATRLFVPEELAKFNMFSTYGSLIASVCYLGLDQAYVRFSGSRRENRPVRACTPSARWCRWLSALWRRWC